MIIFKDGENVNCSKAFQVTFGKVCEHKNDKIEWITIHIVNGKRGEFISPRNLSHEITRNY